MSDCAVRGHLQRSARFALAAVAVVFINSGLLWQSRAEGMPNIQTVFIVLMENNAWSAIKGNTNAPYLNNVLLPQSSYCENYQNVPGLHPSLPNYLWLEAGTSFGITDDSNPAVHHQSTTNHLVTLLKNAGVSWKTYQEDISGAYVPLTGTNGYAPKHNPFVYFDDVTGTNNVNWPYGIAHVRPYTEFARDLTNNAVARYNFITPNQCNDMHDNCYPLQNGIRQGDNWLAAEVPKILASQAYSNSGALFITWDESFGTDTRIGMIVISPLAKGGGYANSNYYTHSSMLKTLQEVFDVSPLLGDAVNATNLGDLFRPAGSPPVGFRIGDITHASEGVIQVTATGVNTNTPLVLEWSSNLLTWEGVNTNPAPTATVSISVTNEVSRRDLGFYRFVQWLP
jgi:hypothetical protein